MQEPQALNKLANSTEYSIYPTKGGFITNDVTTPELFCQLMVGVSGSAIIETSDGEQRYYPLLNAGVIYPIAGIKVVSESTVDGQAVATSASNIWWYGGL